MSNDKHVQEKNIVVCPYPHLTKSSRRDYAITSRQIWVCLDALLQHKVGVGPVFDGNMHPSELDFLREKNCFSKITIFYKVC